jgi:hypothetical protein
MKHFMTELPRPWTPIQATPILPLALAAISDGAVAAAVTAAPVVLRNERRVKEEGFMGGEAMVIRQGLRASVYRAYPALIPRFLSPFCCSP